MVDVIDVNAIPAVARVRQSPIFEAKEWKEVTSAVSGLKPQKAIRVTLSKDTLKLSKNVAYQFKRHLAKHLSANKETAKFEIALRKGADGSPVIYVSNPAAAK